jgi:Ca-activated chloride channel family protein
MNHESSTPILHITTLWERDAVSRDGDETALVVRIRAADTGPRTAGRAPLDIAFALDRSGSMHGPDKIDLVKDAVIAATHHLTDDDRVALVVFDHEVDVLHELTPATSPARNRVARVLADIDARGSTDLAGGWLTACQELASGGRSNGAVRLQRSLVLTDGLANQGITDPAKLITHATELRRRGIDTTTIGVGRHFDEMLLSGMAEAGGGAFEYISDTARLRGFFEKEIGDLMDIVSVRPKLSITFPEGVRGRLVNRFPVDRRGKVVTVDLRDLASGDEVVLVFDITVREKARADDLSPMVNLEWTHPRTGRSAGTHQEVPALRLVDAATARSAPRNDEAAGLVALERTARDHREAMRLDREGQFDASRARFQQSADRLAQAPQSAEIREEMELSMQFASMKAAPMDEHTRKQRVFETQARSRGKRTRP